VGVKPADLASSAHYGVLGMRERMVELGGTLDIRPGPAGGTVVEAQMPLCLPYEQQVRR
ncbi:MAG: histidine kinase, partial [Chloroflexi bacterium SZAS-1]|nr:histidine kinase [Chloroflexi bacterium SZAS-1]